MTILGTIKYFMRKVINKVVGIRKYTKPVKELTTAEKIDVVHAEFEAWQESYNISQKRVPREKWKVFDTMVNDLIDQYDYDYNTAVDEVKFMLKTDPIDLDEGYQDFLEQRYNI